MSKKEFIGISLEGDVLKIAQVHLSKGKLSLDKLDRITLIEKLDKSKERKDSKKSNDDTTVKVEAESVFGIEEKTSPNDTSNQTSTETAVKTDTDILSVAEGEVSEQVESNEMLIHNLLISIDSKWVNIGLNISSGSTIFQIVKGQNHLDLKKKELSVVINEKLESIYGDTKSSDHYAYEVRDDGTLILASNDNEIELLNLIDQSKDLYSGKVFIKEILPDEAALIGLVRNNYQLEDYEITGIVNLGEKTTRLIFLKGNQVWSVTPLINEGTKSKNVLSTVYSKILFQLDTSELPSLERIVITNNVLGDSALTFFKKNFTDIKVENLNFDDRLLTYESDLKHIVPSYTSAIALAWAAAGYKNEAYKSYSFLPGYIVDRQKVFKLQWHGVLFLLLIAFMPALFNYLYKNNLKTINSLQSEILRTDNQIKNVRPLVIGVNDLSSKYNQINQQLKRLDALNKGTDKWGKTLSLVNNGVAQVNGCWIINMRKVKDGLLIQGYSLYRSRIPRFTDLFSKANLQDVHVGKMKGKKVYKFTVMVQKVLNDKTD